MAYISFKCAHCQGNLRAQHDAAGLSITCPICEGTTLVPEYRNGAAHTADEPGVVRAEQPSFINWVGTRVSTAAQTFRTLDYADLMPQSDTILFRSRGVQWVLMAGIAPLIFFQIQRYFQLEFSQVIWMIQGYFCLLWGLFMYTMIQPRRDIWSTAVRYALFTATLGIPILLFTARLPLISSLPPSTDSNIFARAIGYILGVGLLEETCKALPLIIYGMRKGHIRSTRDGLFLGFVSGLAFAAAEGVQYTLVATMLAQTAGDFSGQILQMFFRLMTGPILHGAMAGTVGWFIAKAIQNDTEHKWATIVLGIGLMGTLHGLYNTFSGQLIGIGIATAIFTLFLMYMRQSSTAELTAHQQQIESTAAAD